MSLLAMLLTAPAGCSRTHYRNRADQQVYGIEAERALDPRWKLPDRPVEADPRSRLADPYNPDREPIPPDDPGARLFQVSNGRSHEFHGWDKRGKAPIEFLGWQRYLPMDEKGRVVLSPQSSMQIAVRNSREYQTNVEDVYLQSLSLTLARFQFMVQAFGGQRTFYNQFGSKKTDSNQLNLTTNDGFNLQMMSGAQLVVDFANSLVWEFHGKGFHQASSSMLVGLTQPLLRGAFARIVTQQLSLSERQTLYAIRAFAHYRRNFYVNIVAGNGYLGLLTQLQGIRNQENNLQQLERNLLEYNELVKAGFVNPLDRDLIAQNYQQSQLLLVTAQANLQTQLDLYKIQLGLPPDTPVELDDSILKIFELNDPRLDALRTSNDKLFLANNQFEEPPPLEFIADTSKKHLKDIEVLKAVLMVAKKEMTTWNERIETEKKRKNPSAEDKKVLDRQVELFTTLSKNLVEVEQGIAADEKEINTLLGVLNEAPREDSFKKLRDLVGSKFRGRLSEVFVAQTQTRVFLIDLPRVDMSLDEAVKFAFENRLDLMNSQGVVTDEWRNEEVDANALRGYLNLVYTGNLATAPGKKNELIRYDSSNSSHKFGIQFDAPLNRMAERNTYRAQQITYQRARRAYMANHDDLLRQIRLDMRELNLSRRQFEIGREQLLIAARQVDQAEYNLRNGSGAGAAGAQSGALQLLSILQSLLAAKNGLILNWVSYETNRMSLYRDFDTMDINAEGVWTNEPSGTSALAVGSATRTFETPPTGNPDTDAGAPPPPPPTSEPSSPFATAEP